MTWFSVNLPQGFCFHRPHKLSLNQNDISRPKSEKACQKQIITLPLCIHSIITPSIYLLMHQSVNICLSVRSSSHSAVIQILTPPLPFVFPYFLSSLIPPSVSLSPVSHWDILYSWYSGPLLCLEGHRAIFSKRNKDRA